MKLPLLVDGKHDNIKILKTIAHILSKNVGSNYYSDKLKSQAKAQSKYDMQREVDTWMYI
jgi:hypothetical protein